MSYAGQTVSDVSDVTFARENFSQPAPRTKTFCDCHNVVCIECNCRNVDVEHARQNGVTFVDCITDQFEDVQIGTWPDGSPQIERRFEHGATYLLEQ